MVSSYYEIEKMMQIRIEDSLHKAKQERLVRMIKSRKNERGWWVSLISLVDHIIRPMDVCKTIDLDIFRIKGFKNRPRIESHLMN